MPVGEVEFRHAGEAVARAGLFDVIVEPFFFPLSSLSSLSYAWQVDGSDAAASTDNPRLITTNTGGRQNQNVSINTTITAPQLSQTSYPASFNLLVTP